MVLLKRFLKTKFSDFFFFYSYLGNKIFISIFLSFFVGLMDGLGLAMFIPLLQMVDGSSEFEANQENVGNMVYFIRALNSVGLSMNLVTILLLILVFFSLKGIFRFLESYYGVVLNTNFVKKVRNEGVDAITNLNYKFFVNLDSGKIQNTLSSEIVRLKMSFSSYASSIQAFITVCVYVFLAFITNPEFALLVLLGGILSNFFYTRLYKKTKETSKNISNNNSVFHGLMIQHIHNFKYLRATGQIALYGNKIKKAILDLAIASKKIGFYNSLLMATKEPLSIAVVVMVILVQTHFFSTELGPIILSLLFFYRSLNQMIIFQNNWNNFLNYSGSLENYKEFIYSMKENKVQYDKGYPIISIDSMELKDVCFSYGRTPILNKINIKIPKNKTIAFVGESGSGKTTITNIIAGLLPVDSGKFMVNEKALEHVNRFQYQSRIGYITQEPVIFNDTLFNNITFWAPKTKENLVRFQECISKVSLDDFIENLELKEETNLGNNGVQVSGGQKQRIAIARELYKNIDLLIMDEATSALDSSTELEIQSYFEKIQGSFTIIVIAHRLSTIKSADIICLMSKGELVNYGDFQSLQILSPEFKRMVELQEFKTIEN